MKYVLIDDATSKAGICEAGLILEKTDAQARKSAKLTWECLSEYDQNRRDAFYLLKMKDADYKKVHDNEDCEQWYGDFGILLWSAK